MPAVIKYLPPSDTKRTDFFSLMKDEKSKRKDAYNRAWDYYNGKQPSQLDRKDKEPDDNVIINVTREAIDRTLSFLFPAMPIFELDPDTSEETPDEAWLRETWEANGGLALVLDMAMFGALSGQSYLRIMPADIELTGHPYPQVLTLDPSTVMSYWRADDMRVVVWHEICWQVGDAWYLIDFVKKPDGWYLYQWVNAKGYQSTGWELEKEEIWPLYNIAPIVYTKHLPYAGSFYGKAETEFLDLNDKLNLLASENNRIIRYHSSPKTVATGTDVDQITETSIDQLWAVKDPNAKVYNLEMKSELIAARAQADMYHDQYLSQSRVVILKGDVKDFQRVTNAGVRTVFLDMLSKNIILRSHYGRLLQQAARRLLILGGKGDRVPDILHQDPLPTDDTERTNVANAERSMGIVSRQTVSQKFGYDWTNELTKMEEEQKNPVFQGPVQQAAQNSAQPIKPPVTAQ